jgi:hypothetical protein
VVQRSLSGYRVSLDADTGVVFGAHRHEQEHGSMRIFVGYGYNDRDKWIEDLVFPLLESFGCDVVEGKVWSVKDSAAVRILF